MRIPIGTQLATRQPLTMPSFAALPEPEMPFPAASGSVLAPVPQTFPGSSLTYDAFLYSQLQNSAQPGTANTYTAVQTFATAPPASATQAALQIGTGAFDGTAGAFSGAAGGTLIGVNLGASAARLIDVQVQGVSKLTFGQGGNLVIAGSLTAQGNLNVISAAPQAVAGLALLELGAGGFAGASGNFAGSASGTHLGINAVPGYAGDFFNAQVNGVSAFKVGPTGQTTTITDAGTNTEPILINWQHRSSGTPGAGFGSTLLVQADNASNALTDQLAIATGWSSAVAGAENSLVILSIRRAGVDTEVLRLNANGNGRAQFANDMFHANAAGLVGVFGVGPAGQQTGGALTAGATYTSNEQTMLARLWTAMRAFGFLN
jgi:hypothetical protein